MDATQMISDSIFESDKEENEEENEHKRGRPLAKLCILKNEYIPETELPLFVGDNVLGRDPNTCTLPLSAPSISKQHATICISVYRRKGTHSEMDIEALVWDLGSMNGTRKGHLKLTPNVRYALGDGDSLVVADIPCHYVSCDVNSASSQGDLSTPLRRNSGVKARLPEASGGKRGYRSTGSKKCVDRETKPRVSLTKTPVSASFLSSEQTPTQPQGTLVPKSDSESEDEIQGRGTRGYNALASDSDSHKSTPTCSTFLSPINKIVPESEDESPITPLSSTKNRLYSDVSLSKEETEVDMARQQMKPVVDNSEEKEERVTPVVIEFDKNDKHVATKPERNVHLTGDDELPVCTLDVSKNPIPSFNMDSDTDMEEEEEGMTSAGHVTLTLDHVSQLPNTEHFHMDSNTDVDEDEDPLYQASNPVPSSDDHIKPNVISVIQPEGIAVDSDTDVDDDPAVSDAATKAKPMSYQSACTTATVNSAQLKDFFLDSDTDVDEEAERECITNKSSSKIDASHTTLDKNSVSHHSTHAASHSLHLNSDTDEDEAKPTPSLSAAPVVCAPTESFTTAITVPDLGILSDSDTDGEANSPIVKPVAVTSLSVSVPNMSEALQSDLDADTDIDESSVPPAGNVSNPADHRVDRDTGVEYKEEDIQELDEGKFSKLCIEKTPELLLPSLQTCSTPVQYSEREVENMDTQIFLNPSVPFTCVAAPVVALSSGLHSQEEEDFVVAETQSFVLQTRNCQGNPADNHIMEPIHAFGIELSDDEKDEQSSKGRLFNLGLSERSHLQCQAQALAMESTQAFLPVERNFNLDDTQSYAAISTADSASAENATNMEATQDYGVDDEPARCSVMSEKEGQVDLALEATQAYISEPCSDSDNETNEKENSQASNFPTSFTLAMAQTQPMSGFVEEESLATATDRREEHVEAAQPQESFFSEALSIAETQPLHTCDDEGLEVLINSGLCALETQLEDTVEDGESDEEDSLPISRKKRRAKPLQLEETQSLSSFEVPATETQPEVSVESDDGDLIPGSRKRKAKRLQLEDEQTQPVTNSELVAETQPLTTSRDGESDVESEEEKTPTLINTKFSAVEVQPVNALEDGDGDEKHLSPISPQKRALQLEATQPLSSPGVSTVETQPTNACEDEERIKEDSVPGPAKPLQLDVEQTQPLTNSDVYSFETQPIVIGEVKDSGNEDSLRGPCKRKAKAPQTKQIEPQMLTHYEISSVKIQPMETKSGVTPKSVRHSEPGTSGVAVGNKQGTREKLKEQEQQTKCSDPSKRQTRGKNKTLPNNSGRRGQSKPDEIESEEEEEVVHPKKTRGKQSVDQQKDKEEENQLETEINQHVESKSIIKENQEQRVENKKDAANFTQQEREKMEKENEICEREKEEIQGHMEHKQEQLQREIKGTVKQQMSQAETAERLTLENEGKKREENEILETEKKELGESLQREKKEQEHQERLEKEKEVKQMEEQQEKKEENMLKVPTRGRRAARRTNALQIDQDANISTNDDVPARRTRSRSNSSNSVSSERSASSTNTQESRGRGRGRGVKRISESPQAATTRCSNRRRTVAAETSLQDHNEISPQRRCSRSNSSNSLNSEISNCSVISQIRGRGGRQRGRGRKTNLESILPVSGQSNLNSAPKPATRGRKSKKVEGSSNEVFQENNEKSDCQYTTTTRGQRQASRDDSEPEAADEQGQSNQEGRHSIVEPPLTKTNVRGRGQKAVKSENFETPTVVDGDEAKHKRMGRKRASVQNTVDDLSSRSNIFREKEKAQTTDLAEGKGKDQPKAESPVQAKRRGRSSSARAKKNAKESPPKVELKDESENLELETVAKRARCQPSAAQEKKKEVQDDNSGASVSFGSQNANIVTPQTPRSSVSRKRQTSVDSFHAAKTPRSSSASPSARDHLRVSSQAYKVLFTGMVDEEGERVLTRLGGSIAKGVADMNCLVTDKVRRTVKFLCAVAKGIPIVTTQWLEKSGKAGSFLHPNVFVVKDPEQEKKFSFSLQESLRTASSQPLLQGYEIHVTKSVKPEPVQMKDIISCCGATFLPKMPSSYKLQTVVISCEEDWSLCGPAVSASLPVVTAEFILTGILQQKVAFQTHTLSAPATNPQPARGRGRGRKKT